MLHDFDLRIDAGESVAFVGRSDVLNTPTLMAAFEKNKALAEAAGLGAAVYGASEGLSTLVVEGTALGGQAGTSRRIENYLGFPAGITGSELTSRAVTTGTFAIERAPCSSSSAPSPPAQRAHSIWQASRTSPTGQR